MKAEKIITCGDCHHRDFEPYMRCTKTGKVIAIDAYKTIAPDCSLPDWPEVSRKEIIDTWPKSAWAKDEIRRFIDWLCSKGVIIREEDKDGK